MKKNFVLTLLLIFSLKLLWPIRVCAYEKKRFLNVDGGIGVGFYDVPSGANNGGFILNVDYIPINFSWFGLGLSSGLLNILKSSIPNQEIDLKGVPLGLMMIAFVKKAHWNSYPYIQLTPSLYLLDDLDAKSGGKKIGYGFHTGLGLFIPISQTVFIDLSLRYHRFESWNNFKKMFSEKSLTQYQMLSSNFGICKKF